jgi:hypothetical protein
VIRVTTEKKINLWDETKRYFYGILFVITIFSIVFLQSTDEKVVLYQEEFNNLTITVYEPSVEPHEDTGELIVSIPMKFRNDSDHGFITRNVHTYINGEYLTTFFSEDDQTDKIVKRGTTEEGSVIINTDIKDISELKNMSINYFVTDLKEETKKDYEFKFKISEDTLVN